MNHFITVYVNPVLVFSNILQYSIFFSCLILKGLKRIYSHNQLSKMMITFGDFLFSFIGLIKGLMEIVSVKLLASGRSKIPEELMFLYILLDISLAVWKSIRLKVLKVLQFVSLLILKFWPSLFKSNLDKMSHLSNIYHFGEHFVSFQTTHSVLKFTTLIALKLEFVFLKFAFLNQSKF